MGSAGRSRSGLAISTDFVLRMARLWSRDGSGDSLVAISSHFPEIFP